MGLHSRVLFLVAGVAGVVLSVSSGQAQKKALIPFPTGYRHWTLVKSMVIYGNQHPLFNQFGGLHNVYVNDQNLGGLSRADAHAALAKALDPYLNGPITLTYGGKQWTPRLGELGMTIDLDQTVDEAYGAGRSGGVGSRLRIP